MSRRKQARPKSCKNDEDIQLNTAVKVTEECKLTDILQTSNDENGDDVAVGPSDGIVSTKAYIFGHTDLSDEEISTATPKVFRCECCYATFTSLNQFMDHRNYECLGEDESSMVFAETTNGGFIDRSDTPLSSISSQSPVPAGSEPMSPKSQGMTPEQVPYVVGVSDGHPYACQYCEKAFARLGHLKIHEQVHSDQLPFKCTYCNRLFRHKRSRDRHMKLHTGIKKYKCTECTSAFARSDHLKSHLRTHKNDKNTQCPVCNRGFQNTAALTSHMFSQHKPSSSSSDHKCLQCQDHFTNMHDLQAHILTHIKSEHFQCSYCGDSFTTQDSLDIHIDTHLSDKKIKCPICFEELDTTEDLLQHMEVHNETINNEDTYRHNEAVFSISTNEKEGLGADMITVPALPSIDGTENLICPYCMDGGFDNLEMLEIHMQSVHSVKSTEIYTCNYCNAPYPNLYSLHAHMNVVHSNQPCLDIKYPCSLCTEQFSSIETLYNHKKKQHKYSNTQTPEQDCFCMPCGIAFPDSGSLEEHKLTSHVGMLDKKPREHKYNTDRKAALTFPKDGINDKPQVKTKLERHDETMGSATCDQCNATFHDIQNFQAHMKLHMDSVMSKFSCQQCNQHFPTEELLESHSAMHYLSLTTEYGCTSCMKLFTKPDELQKHLLDIHAHHLYRCSLCKEIFDSKVNIQVHFAIKHSNECKLYKCTQCQNVFRSEMEWQVHVRVNHLKMAKPYRCLFCKESFSNEMELQCHLTTHSKPFKCSMCDEAFHIEYMLDQHLQAVHGDTISPTKQTIESSPKPSETKPFQKVSDQSSPILSATLSRSWEQSPSAKSSPSHPNWTIPKSSPVSQMSPSQVAWGASSPGGNQTNAHLPTWNATSPVSASTTRTPPSNIWKNVEPLHICNICDMKFSEMSLLQLHKVQDHGVKTSKQVNLSGILNIPNDKIPNMNQAMVSSLAMDKPTSSCTFCSQVFKNKNEYEKHMKIHINNGNLKCNICDEVFPTPDILAEHKLQHCKIQQGNACVICKVGLKSEDQFYIHSQEHGYQGSLLQCIVCRQTLASLVELQMHGKHHFQNKQNFSTCCVCLKSFDSKENLISKLNSTGRTYYVCKPCYHGESEEFKCSKCTHTFTSNSQLEAHMQTHQQSFQCIKCQQSFSSEYEIQLHVATHMMQEGILHECKLCTRTFDSPAKLQCHLIEHTYENNSEIICCVCCKLFASALEIQSHALEHGGSAKKYACGKCEQKFFFSAELENHYLTTGHGPSTDGLECPECHKTFANSVNMMNHRRIHEKKENVIKCLLCKELFTTVFSMQQHFFSSHSRTEIEKENKVFQCNQCDQEFPCLSNLQGHLRSHKPGNQFPCPVCNKMFALARNLTIHMRSHSGEKPYECPICNKRFSRKENRKHHMKSHNATKPFLCPVCGKTFTRKCHVKDHMRTHYSQQDAVAKLELSNLELDLPSDTSEDASLNGLLGSDEQSDLDESQTENGIQDEDEQIMPKKIKLEVMP
ncbi:zinc finger protein 423 isoform X1 [Patella vulgata]|uniref:zinc finger protein 423 isoform X1 n=2 Tax=Patella vulgata TaxID=6465 RepID=UPI00217F38C2|nr:zinc finger protein 423 isoform X1 [Patella vulgata]